jgi:Flp pilus assembly protein TadB
MKRLSKAQENPELHWHLAAFAIACLPVLAGILVRFDLMTVARAISTTLIAAAYVVYVTWRYTRKSD